MIRLFIRTRDEFDALHGQGAALREGAFVFMAVTHFIAIVGLLALAFGGTR